jgi:hypothetical protein
VLGLYTELFWGINFSLQKEWNGLKEPNINRFTRPSALTYTWDYSHQINTTPFFMDARLRIRDEEDTESTNSYMSGEDSIEVSGGVYYREYADMEVYLTGSFTQYNPERLQESMTHRIEAQFMTGMKYLFDTKTHWSAVGNFDGFVYKDLNGDGVRQAGEPGIAGMVVTTIDGKSATTDANGFYSIKSVAGKRVALTLDNAKIPYGYAPTGAVRREVDIIQDKTQSVDFGLTPRSEITGIIYNDLNGNGKYELTDGGVRKVKVVLENGASKRSNGIGVYSFPEVIAGEHTVSLAMDSLPEGYLPEDIPKRKITVLRECGLNLISRCGPCAR